MGTRLTPEPVILIISSKDKPTTKKCKNKGHNIKTKLIHSIS